MRSVQLVGLSSHVVMVVVVLSNGSVENETIETDDEVPDAAVAAASPRCPATSPDAAVSAPLSRRRRVTTPSIA